MSNSLLTGTEAGRFWDIQNKWLVFEPLSNSDFSIINRLYSVPIGQTIKPELILNSGSYTSISGAIDIEKIIHKFSEETSASEFLTTIGEANVIAVERTEHRVGEEIERVSVDIQLVNLEELEFSFDFLDARIEKGFYIEVFTSGTIASGGLEHIGDKIILDKNGNISRDTYLKYFKIEVDK